MAEFPTMPFHTDAYLADTRHLTTIEHGTYMLLLITAWRNGGSLPNDDKLLARYASLGPRQWQRIKPTIMQFFHEENGSLYNGKLSDTLVAIRTKSEKASDSARAKWRKNKETGHANAPPKQCERNAIQNQSQREKEDTNVSSKKKTGLTICPTDFAPTEKTHTTLVAEGFTSQTIDGARREMIDWSQAGRKMKHDWDATLRNWVRRNGSKANGSGAPLSDKQARRQANIAEARKDLAHG